MTNSTDKDFDAIAAAMESGDLDALEKLMTSEENQETVVEEEAEPIDSAVDPALLEDTPTEEVGTSEDSPEDDTEVADGETKPEDTSATAADAATEAATPAASTASEREKELERELQRYKSDAGRVPFIQRRMAELEREVRAYKARDTQPTQGVKVSPDGVELDEETKKQIEELREIDPVMAKTMERVAKAAIAGSKAQVDQAFTTFTQVEQEHDDENFLMNQRAELVRDVPKAYEIFALPQWQEWKDTLTPGQRAMAESSYAADVKQAIYAFAATMQKAQGTEVVPTQVVTTVPAATPASTEVSDKVKEARNRKVATSAEVKTSSAKKTVELDEDAYFREMYEKVGKENHILK